MVRYFLDTSKLSSRAKHINHNEISSDIIVITEHNTLIIMPLNKLNPHQVVNQGIKVILLKNPLTSGMSPLSICI